MSWFFSLFSLVFVLFARERHQKCAAVHEHGLEGTLAGSFRGDLRSEVTCDSRLEEFSLKEMNSMGGIRDRNCNASGNNSSLECCQMVTENY